MSSFYNKYYIAYTRKDFLYYTILILLSGADNMYVVCNEHLENAIEEFVETYEQSPDIYELEKVSFTDWASPHHCNYCVRIPKYLVV